MPKMTMIVARLMRLVDSQAGSVITKSPSTMASSTRVPTTSGRRRSSRGIGRISLVACQVAEASLSTRAAVRLRRVSNSPASTIPNRTASL